MLKALAKDVAIYGAGEFVFKFIAFAVFPIYAHVLSVAEFGIWALLQVTVLLLGYFASVGVSQAMQRYYFDAAAGEGREASIVSTGLVQLLASAVVVTTGAMLAVWAFAAPLAADYGIALPVALLALAAIVPDQLLQYCLDVLRIHFTPLKFLALSFAKNVIGTLVALYLLLVEGAGLAGLFVGLLAGSLAAVPIGLWLIRRDLAWHYSPVIGRALLAFGGPLVFTSVAHWVYTSLDRWMLAEMTTPEEVGLYSVAAKFATILTFVISAFAQAWTPFAIRMARDDPDHQAFFGRVLSLWSFAIAFGALGIALFAGEALTLLTPPVYWPATPIVPLLVAGVAIYGTTLVTALGITLAKRTSLFAIGTWLAAAINVGLNLVLIPRYGAVGTAAATLFAYFALTAFCLVSTQRLHPIPLERGKLCYSAVLIGLAAASAAVDFGAFNVTGVIVKTGILLLALAGAFAAGLLDRSTLAVLRPKGTKWRES